MKKFYTLLAIVLLAVAAVLTFSACGNSEDSGNTEKCADGEHVYGPWQVYEEALCNKMGIQRRECLKCRLDIQQRKYEDKDNHNFVDFVCTRCALSNAPKKVGFQLSSDESYYILYTVEDKGAKNYVVPSEYEGKPVKEIASKAFEGCSLLETVEIPSSVLKIGESAFTGCHSLTKMTIPFVGRAKNSSIETFGYIFGTMAYNNSSGITQKVDGVDILYYIPTSLIDVTVTGGKINDSAFQNCVNIKRITIPSDVTKIGDYAFSDCRSLTNITLSENVEKIGKYAFQYCESLDVFPLVEGVEEIDDYAFAGCTKASYLEFPSTVESMGIGSFLGCSGIGLVVVPGNIRNIPNYIFQKCTGLTEVTLEEGVRSVGRFAFSECSSLNKINFPSTIEEIEKGGFERCTGLIDITIPSTIEEIGEYSFQNCSGLKTLTVSEGVKEISEYAFSFCSGLETVYLPASLTEFQLTSFVSCDSLTTFEIHKDNESFSTINGNIYNYTGKSLILYSPGNRDKSFEIPEGVTDIAPNAFLYAPFLEEIVFSSTVPTIPANLFKNHPTLKSIVIREGVQLIGEGAFESCKALQSVTIHGVQTISKNAFNQCNMLTDVVIERAKLISETAFYKCASLKNVSLAYVDKIDEYAFSECPVLESISLYHINDEMFIMDGAFAKCSGLKSVTIGQNVKYIGIFAFAYCTSLTEVKFVNCSLESISNSCFIGCTSLPSIQLPGSLKKINATVFEGCTSLNEITVDSSTQTFNSIQGHLYSNSTLVIFAPGQFAEEISIPDFTRNIGPFVFRNADMIKKVNFPESVKFVDNESFYNTGLTELDLGSIETIGTYAFGSCEALTFVEIKKSVTKVDDYAFQDCVGIEKIYLYNTLITMGEGVFHKCNSEATIYTNFSAKEVPETWSKDWNPSSMAVLYNFIQ